MTSWAERGSRTAGDKFHHGGTESAEKVPRAFARNIYL